MAVVGRIDFEVRLTNLEFEARIVQYSVRLKFSSRPDNVSHMGNRQRLSHTLDVSIVQRTFHKHDGFVQIYNFGEISSKICLL